MNIPLFHKILTLVLVPLIVGLVWAAALYHQLNLLEDEVRAFQIVNHLASLEDSIFKVAQGLGQMAFSGNDHHKQKHFFQKYERYISTLPQIMTALDNDLTTAQKRHPSQMQVDAINDIHDLQAIYPKIKEVSNRGAARISQGLPSRDTFDDLIPLVKDYKHQLEDIQRAAQQLTGLEPGEGTALIERLHETQRNIALMAAIFVTVALISTVYAAREIEVRLRRIMANTQRLAKREKLEMRVGGSDEIALLSKVLYESSEVIYQLEEKEQQKIKAKEQFMQMISHDLRTPLTSIQLFLNMLAEGTYGQIPERAQQKARIADANASRLVKLVNDLLEIERIESGQLELIPSRENASLLVQSSIQSVQELAERQLVRLDLQHASGAEMENCDLYVDRHRIIQVIVNLLGNAIKFSPPNSTVTVTLEKNGDLIKFSIIDQGRGISTAPLDQIFSRFKQVEREDVTDKHGSGLGLAICKSIIEQSGGTIGVESMVGRGSTFWFVLPGAPAMVTGPMAH
jgi:signal transduction histidine kinase